METDWGCVQGARSPDESSSSIIADADVLAPPPRQLEPLPLLMAMGAEPLLLEVPAFAGGGSAAPFSYRASTWFSPCASCSLSESKEEMQQQQQRTQSKSAPAWGENASNARLVCAREAQAAGPSAGSSTACCAAGDAPFSELPELILGEGAFELPQRDRGATRPTRAMRFQLADARLEAGGLVLQVGDKLLVPQPRLPRRLRLPCKPARGERRRRIAAGHVKKVVHKEQGEYATRGASGARA